MTAVKIPYKVENSDLRNDFLHRILPTAINSLNKQHQARWGKMSAQHMVDTLAGCFPHVYRRNTSRMQDTEREKS